MRSTQTDKEYVMKKNHPIFKVILIWVSDWCLIIGDVLFAVSLVHLITQFEAHPSYPFLGLKGVITILGLYSVGIICEFIKLKIYPNHEI